ncbi:MAG: hypothetical protein JST40_09515 [Armatimonadetes bacterium]|nr:hypothetical protein [Armatimonadota bacterium]
MKKALTGIAIVGALSVAAFAGVSSGLNKGERVSPFHPSHVAGPLANTTNCFPCTFQARPQAQVWVNGDSKENVMKIAHTLDSLMATHEKKEFKAMVVFVTSPKNVETRKTELKTALKNAPLKHIDVAVLASDNEAVKSYKFNLSNDVKNTVFLYKNWVVEQKMVNFTADEKGLGVLTSAISELVK